MTRPKDERLPLPAFIDLEDWIRMRVKVSRKKAQQIIMSGAIRSDTHVLGYFEVPYGKEDDKGEQKTFKIYEPRVSTGLRKQIHVVRPLSDAAS